MLKSITLMIAFFFASVKFLSIAQASCRTEGSLNVSAIVAPHCTITATPLQFNHYNSAKLLNDSKITVRCTKGTQYKITLDNGSAPKATADNRKMFKNQTALSYKLYQNNHLSKSWGEDQDNSLTETGTGHYQSFTVYGVIPENQKLPAGTYEDIINASVILRGAEQVPFSCQLSVPIKITAIVTLP